VLSPISSFLRLVSVALCLIVGVSFLLFVINQTGSASAQQQRELNHETVVPGGGGQPSAGGAQGSSSSGDGGKSSPRKTIDEVAEAVTSPFSGLTESWSSEWLKRGVLLLLTLAIYGFGLSFVARAIRVRL
jgi:hypothetical protein